MTYEAKVKFTVPSPAIGSFWTYVRKSDMIQNQFYNLQVQEKAKFGLFLTFFILIRWSFS